LGPGADRKSADPLNPATVLVWTNHNAGGYAFGVVFLKPICGALRIESDINPHIKETFYIMSCLGNILWLIFGGFLASLGYILGGLVMMLTIIGIPFGIQSIKIGVANLAPFGKRVEKSPHADSFLALLFDIFWFVFFGWGIALVHVVSGIVLAITIIGIPFAKQHFKLIPIALLPFRYQLVEG
jgi:uncharacterized membrane protein YccF (DUF307 family)